MNGFALTSEWMAFLRGYLADHPTSTHLFRHGQQATRPPIISHPSTVLHCKFLRSVLKKFPAVKHNKILSIIVITTGQLAFCCGSRQLVCNNLIILLPYNMVDNRHQETMKQWNFLLFFSVFSIWNRKSVWHCTNPGRGKNWRNSRKHCNLVRISGPQGQELHLCLQLHDHKVQIWRVCREKRLPCFLDHLHGGPVLRRRSDRPVPTTDTGISRLWWQERISRRSGMPSCHQGSSGTNHLLGNWRFWHGASERLCPDPWRSLPNLS